MNIRRLSLLGYIALLANLQPLGLQAESVGSKTFDAKGADRVSFHENDARVAIDNLQDVEKITKALDEVLADPNTRLRHIVISGYASPDGTYENNARLARMRANSLRAYVRQRYDLPLEMVETRSIAEDWEGLENFVASASHAQLPHREALLTVIRSSQQPDAKKQVLRSRFPAEYSYLKENCMPQLRRSEYKIIYDDLSDNNSGSNGSVDGTLLAKPKQSQDSNSNPLIGNNDEATAANMTPRMEVVNDEVIENDTITITSPTGESHKVVVDKVVVLDSITRDSANSEAMIQFIINESLIRKDMNGNADYLDKIAQLLDKIIGDKSFAILKINLTGYASPDGPYNFNKELAKNRTESLKSLICNRYNIPAEVIFTNSIAEDWKGLEEFVEHSTTNELPHRADILRVIKSNKGLDEKERIIRSYKTDFAYLREHCLPNLRRTEYYIEYDNEKLHYSEHDVTAEIEEPEPDTVVVVEKPKKPFYIAAKTNLLYDAAVIPNIGIELYLGKRWTLAGDWFYTWFYSDTKHRYWQGYGGYLTLRKYFGKKAAEHPFTGQHIGLYGLMMTYDVEWGGRGYQSPDWGFGGGIEYGYSMPIARRLNLDFSLGIGYQDGEYKEYLPMDGHYVWQVTHDRHWFGPTKAEVSLVWLIGRGNKHPKKVKSLLNEK